MDKHYPGIDYTARVNIILRLMTESIGHLEATCERHFQNAAEAVAAGEIRRAYWERTAAITSFAGLVRADGHESISFGQATSFAEKALSGSVNLFNRLLHESAASVIGSIARPAGILSAGNAALTKVRSLRDGG